MTTIHDIGPGSREHELESSLRRMELESGVLARRKDELESVLAAGRLGFCRISGAAREIVGANSQFKAEFGLPPDAGIGWRELNEPIQREDRAKLAAAVSTAFTAGTEVDLIVRTQLPGRGKQWVTIRGRPTNS